MQPQPSRGNERKSNEEQTTTSQKGTVVITDIQKTMSRLVIYGIRGIIRLMVDEGGSYVYMYICWYARMKEFKKFTYLENKNDLKKVRRSLHSRSIALVLLNEVGCLYLS